MYIYIHPYVSYTHLCLHPIWPPFWEHHSAVDADADVATAAAAGVVTAVEALVRSHVTRWATKNGQMSHEKTRPDTASIEILVGSCRDPEFMACEIIPI